MNDLELKNIVDRNFNISNGTFMFFLSESNDFRLKEFYELIEGLKKLAELNKNNKIQDKQEARMIQWINSQILLHIIHHQNPKDGYKIKNFSKIDITLCVNVLFDAVDGYFQGYVV